MINAVGADMCLRPVYLRSKGFAVPCGKCIECNINKARIWAYRIVLEARKHEECCMITLTYNDDNLPTDRSVNRRDIQLFFKRFRKYIYPKKIRYFYCGEYGAKRARPHYHAIVFGYNFSDRYFFKKDKKGSDLFLSPTLQRLWPLGYSSVVDISYEVAKYVAIYLQKPPLGGRRRPFVGMSNRPGIAFDAIRPELIESDKLYLDGKYIKLPRYFLTVLEREGYDLTGLKEKREKAGKLMYSNILANTSVYFRERNGKIKKFERIFGKRLDKNLMP